MQAIEEIFRRFAPPIAEALSDPFFFYLGVIGLIVLGVVLVATTPKYSCAGGNEYERNRLLKSAGALSIAFALGWWGVKEFSDSVLTVSIDRSSIPVSSLAINRASTPVAATPSRVYPFPNYARENDLHPVGNFTAQPEVAPPAPQMRSPLPSPTAPPDEPADEVKVAPNEVHTEQIPQLLGEVSHLLVQGEFDSALDKINVVLSIAPQNPTAYLLRGTIYGQQKHWDLAELDLRKGLQWDDRNPELRYNLAEVQFKQKKYDQARSGFGALRDDPEIGDLATYKVFLCDLLGSHEDIAASELELFNKTESSPSYYFANASWYLYHQKQEDARGWLASAANIYSPAKFSMYAASLQDLGYLPLRSMPNRTLTSAH